MNKTFYDLIVVIPIGPGADTAFICDTMQSVAFGASGAYKIILLDDSQQEIAEKVKFYFPDADIVRTRKNLGGWCGLYISLSHAYTYALLHYTFDVLLKIDTDALVIGKSAEEKAIQLFRENKNMGMAGQYPNEYNGHPWDIEWPRRRIFNATKTWKFIRRPVSNWFLMKFVKLAQKNGYRMGESVFGGAYFMSYACLMALREQGLLPHPGFKTLNLGEDHIFSLLVKAAGFQLGDLSTGNLPFGCAWKGLPDSPEQLSKIGKKIIHSTRYWQKMREEEIRDYFRRERNLV